MSTALIVLDAQKVYTSPGSELYCEDHEATIGNINRLIEGFHSLGLPIVLVRHQHKTDGSDLGHLFDFDGEQEDDFNFKEGTDEVEFDAGLKVPASCIELTKNRYSAFIGTQLESVLAKHGVDTVAVCGFMTNFCCDSTARDALDRNFYVLFTLDATGTPGTENLDQTKIRDLVGELLGAGFARVLSTDECLAELSS